MRHKPRNSKIHGITPGGTDHKMLLALRAGGMTLDQIYNRFGTYQNDSLCRLKILGLITKPAIGSKGESIFLTQFARKITDHDGPLSRKTLITYCQL